MAEHLFAGRGLHELARVACEREAHEIVGRGEIAAGRQILADVPKFRAASVRLLPSGDTYCLLWGADRELLVADARQRAALWTSRVWPGALLVNGEIAGVWRRAAATISIEPWRRLSPAERERIEAEALSLPLPGLDRPIALRWS